MRPAFLARPLDWTRTRRTGQSAVDAAYAISRPREAMRRAPTADLWLGVCAGVALGIAGACVLFFGL